MKVSFETGANDCADVAYRLAEREGQHDVFPHIYKSVVIAAFAALPVLVFDSEKYWVSALTFLLVLIINLGLFRLPTKKYFFDHYRNYYLRILGKEMFNVEIEISEKGFYAKQLENESFTIWQNIVEIGNTESAVFFFQRGGATKIPKQAFASADQFARFMALANSYKESAHQLSNARNLQ